MKNPLNGSLQDLLHRVVASIGLTLLLVSVPACNGGFGNRPYVAARPAYTPPVLNPMRIGGYAGFNYGRGNRVITEAPAVVVPAGPPIRVKPSEEPPLIE